MHPFLRPVFPGCQLYYNNSVPLFRSVSGGSIAPVSLPFSLFSMPISATSFLIIMTWLVLEVLMVVLERGVGVEERRRRRRVVVRGGVEGVREAFTPRLLIPLLKGFCSIMPDSFRK